MLVLPHVRLRGPAAESGSHRAGGIAVARFCSALHSSTFAPALPALGWLGLRAVASGVGDHFESQFRQCCQLLSVNFDLHATRNMRLFACG